MLHLLGVGGYRAGWVWCGLVLAGGGAALAYRVLPDRRELWALAAAIVGVTISARLVAIAPPSHGQLAQRLDGLTEGIPLFKEIDEQTSGHSWCRPACPRVIRVYDVPDTAPFAALATVVLALERRKIHVVPPPGATRIGVRTDDMTLDARARRSPAGDVTMVLDVRGRRAS